MNITVKCPNIQGASIINGLRRFNRFRDDFLVELMPNLSLLGFIMGTVDLLTQLQLATTAWFTLSWAIVQAVTVDGLVYAVWLRIKRTRYTKEMNIWGYAAKYIALLLVGLSLLVVATVINTILFYQQVSGTPSSLMAMQQLGIALSWFYWSRGIIVVATFTLMTLLHEDSHVATNQDNHNSHVDANQDSQVAMLTTSENGYLATNQGSHNSPLAGSQNSSLATNQDSHEETQESLTLGMIEQAMYNTLLDNPGEAKRIAQLVNTMPLEEVTQKMRNGYPQYARYITAERVAKVIGYARVYNPEWFLVANQDSQVADSHNSHVDANQDSQVAMLTTSENGYDSPLVVGYLTSENNSHDGDSELSDSHVTSKRGTIIQLRGNSDSPKYDVALYEKVKGEWVKQLQEEGKVNKKKISEMTGVSYATVKNYAPYIERELAS